jgi:Protein of unknown function (DUF3592)
MRLTIDSDNWRTGIVLPGDSAAANLALPAGHSQDCGRISLQFTADREPLMWAQPLRAARSTQRLTMLTGSALYWTYGIAAFCVLNTLALIRLIWRNRNQVATGKTWARTTGVVLESKVSIPEMHTDDDESDCTPAVRYRYSADGNTYESDRIAFGGQPDTIRMLAEKTVAKYPPGAKVDVLYNPKHPKSAVLESKNATQPASYIFLILFAMASIVFVSHSIAGKMLTTANGVPMFAFMVLLIPIALGFVLVGAYFNVRHERKVSALWPTVTGTITTSDVIEQIHTEETDKEIRDVTEYLPNIRYKYQVGGRDYFSSRRKWGADTIYGMREWAAERLVSYPVGAKVPVYYDPADPATAVLEPKSGRGTLVFLFGAAMFGGMGVLFMWILAANA